MEVGPCGCLPLGTKGTEEIEGPAVNGIQYTWKPFPCLKPYYIQLGSPTLREAYYKD